MNIFVKNISKYLKTIIIEFRQIFLFGVKKNIYKTSYSKNILISYITHPFKSGIHMNHTNTSEALIIAQVFHDLGFNVDIVDYFNKYQRDYAKYDIIFGFGEPLINSFYNRKSKIISIYYGTGMHVSFQNHNTLRRVEDVYKQKGRWLLGSTRLVEKTWSIQTELVDNIITLGNNSVIDSYAKTFPRKIYNIPVTFFEVFDQKEIFNIKNYSQASKEYIWFGSSGFVHKGVDLLLEVFKKNKNLNLHICGPIKQEKEFANLYSEELFNTDNIYTYGFVDIQSEEFKELIIKCGYIIFPSCSEGEPSSVINLMQFGIVPIVTKESGIKIKDFGFLIDELNTKTITDILNQTSNIKEDELKDLAKKCMTDTLNEHSSDSYYDNLKYCLREIIGEKVDG